MQPTRPLSEMELQRERNIARNKAYLASLGIVKPQPVVKTQQQRPPRKKRDSHAAPPSPARRSRRLASAAPEFEPALHAEDAKTAEARRLAGPRASPTPAQVEYAVKEGTASRAHCAHRVATMTDQALANRIKAIERARGRFCIAKMEVFAEVLRERGKAELADAAEAALTRLKAVGE
ncbi:hypothetical protein JKP88DRAFT_234306 [Tribonema minus]|uniref:Uncharacterized protein n=1 Tax=Tribonema minus TaxID=303371 RepID=A0A835ZBM6_9STRA|nr:hypothetical protein JKP88DRAFT_234306 [Tribonema minus]